MLDLSCLCPLPQLLLMLLQMMGGAEFMQICDATGDDQGSTAGMRCIQPPDTFPLTVTVNKSCNTECCVNKMLQIIQNMMIPLALELELSMSRRTTISGQHILI